MENQTIKELTSFIKNSPTAFHAVKINPGYSYKRRISGAERIGKMENRKRRKILCDPQPFQHSCI